MKVCGKCRIVQELEAFYVVNGYRTSPCRTCRSRDAYETRAPLRAVVASRRLLRKKKKAEAALLLRLRRRVIVLLRSFVNRQKYVSGEYWKHYRKAYKKANPDKRAGWRKRYKAIRGRRTKHHLPGWADRKAIVLICRKRKEWSQRLGLDLHVDHIVPLNHPLVCGLHCEANLQLLAADENVGKGNATWPDSP